MRTECLHDVGKVSYFYRSQNRRGRCLRASHLALLALASIFPNTGVAWADTIDWWCATVTAEPGWQNPGRIRGNPGQTCGCNTCSCSASDTALNELPTNHDWLTCTSFDGDPVPYGHVITDLKMSVACKFNDTDDGSVRLASRLDGQTTIKSDVAAIESDSTTDCRFRFCQTSFITEFRALLVRQNISEADVERVQIRFRREASGGFLRAKAIRLRIEIALDFDGDENPDITDPDDDNDGRLDEHDPNDHDRFECGNSDGDTCDDCRVQGSVAPWNDGADCDGDGQCDLSDLDDDNDASPDLFDGADCNPFVCEDRDRDGCDDCSVAGQANTVNDGPDCDHDGRCDRGESDDDKDGREDVLDPAPCSRFVCGDVDGDGCDDCSQVGIADPEHDGADSDRDGLCDAGDSDDDNDGWIDDADPHPIDRSLCGDINQDGLQDCGAVWLIPSTQYLAGQVPISMVNGTFVDGHNPALAVANYGSRTITVLPAASSVAAATQIIELSEPPTSIQAGDEPGGSSCPARATLVVGGSSQGVSLFKNSGGSFNDVYGYDGFIPIAPNASAVAVKDFDFNGLPAIVGVQAAGGAMASRIGDGCGGYPGADYLVDAGEGPTSLKIGSLNSAQDAALDLLVVAHRSGTIHVLLFSADQPSGGKGQSPGGISTVLSQVIGFGPSPNDAAIADFNTDGVNDIAVVREDGVIGVFLGNGDGTFHHSPQTGTALPGAVAVAAGDLDSDGDQDLVVASTNNYPAFFKTLANLGADPVVSDISGDGTFIVGALGNQAFRSTLDGSPELLGDLLGGAFESYASGVSQGGTTVVGFGYTEVGREAFRWTPGDGIVGLGYIAGSTPGQSAATSVSDEGSVIAGWTSSPSGRQAFRWTAQSGMIGLGFLSPSHTSSSAHAVSADGTTIVGESCSAAFSCEGFRWTESEGMISLGLLSAPFAHGASPVAVSADGASIVGVANYDGAFGPQALLWTQVTGPMGLNSLFTRPVNSIATAVSGDGSVAYGTMDLGCEYCSDFPHSPHAFVWDAANGTRPLASLVTALGADVSNFVLQSVVGSSNDNTVLIGLGSEVLTFFPGPPTFAWLLVRPKESVRGSVSLLLNNGNGRFRSCDVLDVGLNPSSLALEDFDGDSDLDIAVANAESNDVGIIDNIGNGSACGDDSNAPGCDIGDSDALSWESWAEDGNLELANDVSRRRMGASSLRMTASGGFDNYVRYRPQGLPAAWLHQAAAISLWVYAENKNIGFQSGSPWIRLGNAEGYVEWRPTYDKLNEAIGQWEHFIVPMEGDATWQRTEHGIRSLQNIEYFELHADTWDAGFELWLDGVGFILPDIVAFDVDYNGTVDRHDWAQLVDQVDSFRCSRFDVDANGEINLGDVASFQNAYGQ